MNEWRVHQDLKKGQATLIAQAWNQHVLDRKKVSTTARELRQVMEAECQQTMAAGQNEVLVSSIEFPSVIVSEIYANSQNVMKEARRRGHGVGSALSLETGWDFLNASHRKAAMDLVKKEQPYLLVLAFPCGPWSALMNLRPSLDLAEKQP